MLVLKSRDSLRLRCSSKKRFFMFLSLWSEHPSGIYMELEWIRTDGEVGVQANHLLNPRESRHTSCQANVFAVCFICYNIMRS